MKAKLLMLNFLIICISGCTIDYQLRITEDKQYIESVVFVVDRTAYPSDKKLAERTLADELKALSLLPEYERYQYKYQITDSKVYIYVNKSHKNIEDFMISPLYPYVFQLVDVFEDYTYMLKSVGEIYDVNIGAPVDSPFYVKNLKVTIIPHNKVSRSNADHENFRKNEFVWEIKSDDNDKKIELELDYSKRYDIIMLNFIKNNLVQTIALVFTIGIIIFFGAYFLIQNKLKNKI